MSLECDPNIDLSNARPVRLAGREFQILPWSLRQAIAITKLTPTLANSEGGMDDKYLAALAEAVRLGCSRAHKTLSQDEFLDLPITREELIAAFPIVMEQGGSRKLEPGEEVATGS
jgi:hypothetical protein